MGSWSWPSPGTGSISWTGAGPAGATLAASLGILAIHGLSQTGWIWAPVARRLGGPSGLRRFVSMDLRGHGLSDAPDR